MTRRGRTPPGPGRARAVTLQSPAGNYNPCKQRTSVVTRTAQRRTGVMVIALALCSLLMIRTAEPARALAPAPVPVSVVTACIGSVVCGVGMAAAAVTCAFFCDDLFDWAHDRIMGTGTGPGAAGIATPPQGAFNPAPTDPPHGDDFNAFVVHVLPGTYPGQTIHYRLWSDAKCQNSAGDVYATSQGLVYSDFTGVADYGFGGTDTVKPHAPLCGGPSPNSPHDLVVAFNVKVENIDDYNESSWVTWSADPVNQPGTYKVTVQCKNPAGQTGTFSQTYTGVALESIVPPDCQVLLSPDAWRTDLKVERIVGTGSGTSTQLVTHTTVDLTPYPQCQNSSAVCTLTLTETTPGNEQCKWGPYTMPLSDCEGLAPEPNPTPSPTTSASPGPTAPPAPCLATSPGEPCESPPPGNEGHDCWPNGWGWFNPAEWVLRPILCALVPSPEGLQNAFGSINDGWQQTGINEWGDAIGGVATSLAGINGDGSCAGPHFEIVMRGHHYDFDPLDACAPPMQTVAVVVKSLLSLTIVVAGARKVARPILAAIGMHGSGV